MWALRVVRDGTLVSGSSGGSVQFWDGAMGTLLSGFKKHEADILALALAQPDEAPLAPGTPGGPSSSGGQQPHVFASGVDSRVACFTRLRQTDGTFCHASLLPLHVLLPCPSIREALGSPLLEKLRHPPPLHTCARAAPLSLLNGSPGHLGVLESLRHPPPPHTCARTRAVTPTRTQGCSVGGTLKHTHACVRVQKASAHNAPSKCTRTQLTPSQIRTHRKSISRHTTHAWVRRHTAGASARTQLYRGVGAKGGTAARTVSTGGRRGTRV